MYVRIDLKFFKISYILKALFRFLCGIQKKQTRYT